MAGEWRVKRLDQLGRIVTGKTPPSTIVDAFGGLIPFVTPSDMDGTRIISTTTRSLSVSGQTAVKNASIPTNAVMVSCIGSDMGKAAIAGIDCVTNQQINSIIVDTDDSPIFVYYNLSTRKAEIRGSASGSAQPILNKSAFGRLEIELPPLPEQRAIAHILGTLDDKIELNRRRNQTLEAMARALFKAWFVDFEPVRAKMEGRWRRGETLPGLPAHLYDLFPDRLDDEGKPEGWEMQSLANFIDIFDSRRVPLSGKQRAERPGPYPYYGAAGVLDSVDDFLFEGVHVLLGEDGSVVRADGRPYTQYVWGKFWVNNHAHVLRGRGISNEALLIFLDQCDVAPFVTGAVQPKLSQGNLKAIPFFYPGEVLLRRFGEIIDPLFAQIRDATEESRTLAQLRDTLLPKLVSGELRIADAETFMERVA